MTLKPSITINDEDKTIAEALAILEERVKKTDFISSPKDAINYINLMLGGQPREVFAIVHLDTRHRVIETEILSVGTVDHATVHPREVLRSVMRTNATAILLAHNHPSGDPTPSRADRQLTATIKEVLRMVDVRVLDHIVVAGGKHSSFAERMEL